MLIAMMAAVAAVAYGSASVMQSVAARDVAGPSAMMRPTYILAVALDVSAWLVDQFVDRDWLALFR